MEDARPTDMTYHLMHPGGDSAPGDPNAAFYLDGVYHLHYILAHPWQGGRSFSFVHVTSEDLLHWTWHPTTLQPAYTGHGMFSGTGFLTKEGRPAVIYHGQGSGRNHIAVANDRKLSGWSLPHPVEVRTPDGAAPDIRHWDPDCFLIGANYYAISGGKNPPLFKSQDLKTWTYVGPFLRQEPTDVLHGEDVSCPNFFRLGNKWMLLCISHPLGCRYYIGDWDEGSEQFAPQSHGRMNWRREGQTFDEVIWRDFFAPESVLTGDGRRVMWAWLTTLPGCGQRTIQSLPRELDLPADGILRVRPAREIDSLRYDRQVLSDVVVEPQEGHHGGTATRHIAELPGDSVEIRVTIPHGQAERKLFGFTLFSDAADGGLPILFRPDAGTVRVGGTEAPFTVADIAPDEDLEIRVFIDRYLVEVFVSDRQALVAANPKWIGAKNLSAYAFGAAVRIATIEIWKLHATTEGFYEARRNPVWEPTTE